MDTAPILLFVYNRPAHTRQALEALSRNTLSADSDLFIYSDAARSEADRAAVEEVRRIVREAKGFRQVHVTEREQNWGLARNIIDGVTTMVNRYGRVIVLEDDLVVAPHFLQFMNNALDVYADVPQVGHIQACDFTNDPGLPDMFLIKWTGSWGWATWKRAWQFFNPDGKALLEELERKKLTYTFDFNGKCSADKPKERITLGPSDGMPLYSSMASCRSMWENHLYKTPGSTVAGRIAVAETYTSPDFTWSHCRW